MLQRHQHPDEHERVVENRVDMSISDLIVAREQIIRHSREMRMNSDNVLIHIEEAIKILEDISY